MIQLQPFDEDLKQREILPHNPIYTDIFQDVKAYVEATVQDIELIHIGSTAVADLRGKPMIDILALTDHNNLREKQLEFEQLGFHRRDVWNDTDEKPYVCASVFVNNRRFNLNIHISHRDHSQVEVLTSFVNTLQKSPDFRRKYEQAKDRAHAANPKDPQSYNRAKESVILEIQQK